MANVKDEPRPWPARRVRHDDPHSVVSFRISFGSTRRDGHGRWLWRLVRLFYGLPFISANGTPNWAVIGPLFIATIFVSPVAVSMAYTK